MFDGANTRRGFPPGAGPSRSPFERGRVVATERRTSQEDAWRLEKAGYVLEVTPAGRRCWREHGTGQLLSGDHAAELLRLEEVRTLEEAGWEQVEDEADTYWRRPDTGRLYPRRAAYDVVKEAQEG
jgi:hypothetical protein